MAGPLHGSVGGAVLAGGSSRRMGRDKAFLKVDGTPLVSSVAGVLDAVVDAGVVVVGGDVDGIRNLGLRNVPDLHPGHGPLGGILTALRHFGGHCDHVVVLSCDLPKASEASVGALLDVVDEVPAVIVAVLEGRRQWMHACWPVSALGLLEGAFAAGERAPRRALGDLPVVEVVGLDPLSLRDVDSPEDLDEAGRAGL
ncbi:MAG: molybdenum cofactor guanylyltransferase [Acidimicrobiales bacterium]